MRLLLAVVSLWAVAVFALRGSDSERAQRYRFTEVDERDVEPFRAGQTYKYRVNTQISSGIASVADQHAVTRLQADALLHFQSDRLVALKLANIEVGTLNHEIQQPEKVQPMEMFKPSEIESEEARLLELPCAFDYADGLVERIRFHQQDQPWSKNIKKSVLNMLQLNLKQRQGQNVELEQQKEWQRMDDETSALSTKNEQQEVSKMFVMPEITLEGECQVTYTINKLNPRNKFNSYYDNELSRDDLKMFNVTKSVDFHRCKKIADLRFGPKIEKPCQNCTNQQELEERRLDRTTILRHVVVGTQEKYGIKKAEVVSHYIFKMLNVEQETPMRTIVAGQLVYIQMEESRRNDIERELKGTNTNEKEETLLYSTQWDQKEKFFYMFGDEEYPQQTGPFQKVQDKVGKIENLMKKIVSMWSDKQKGIESEATVTYSRLVEVLRMCSQEELRQVYSRIQESNSRWSEQEQTKAQEILIDALANAGTLNTIKLLAEKIQRKDIGPARGTRALIQLKELPAPSEKIVKIVTGLCESEACSRHGPCRQVCWLTVGTLMGELCDDQLTVDDAVEQAKPQCHQELKKDFVKKAMQAFEKYEIRYEKITVLKSLGNAGLEQSVQELEKIIRNAREDPLVRMQAIDSLRRLRAVMPQKIQRILMPVYQNVRERPEVRMMCLSQILATFPENAVLDQIGYTLLREPSRQVKSFVYTAMKTLSKSPIEDEKEVAQHLKSLVKLAGITEEEEEVLLRGSRFYRIPVYSKAKKEGFFVDFESMVGPDNVLPKNLVAGLDSLFNGLFQKNGLEISMTQEDLEQWVEKLMDVYMDWQYGQSSKSSRASRYSGSSRYESTEADSDFRKIISDLKIKRRNRVDSDSDSTNNSPFFMLTFRAGDVDHAVLPLEEEILPQAMKRVLVQGQQPSLRDFEDLLDTLKGRPFRAQIAMNLLENAVKIPTSSGFPVRVWHVVPVLASVEGQVKPQLRDSGLTAEINLHPTISMTHLKRVEVWSPIVNSGVETTRTIGMNLPLNSQIRIQGEPKKIQWTIQVPEKQYRVMNVHTLPVTFTSEQDWIQQRTPVVKRIENQDFVNQAKHLEQVYGRHSLNMPFKIQGEVHVPHKMDYEEIIKSLMTTENHFHVEFMPEEGTPSEIVLQAQGEFFQQGESSLHKELKGFRSKANFDDEMDQYYESEDRSDFDRQLDEFNPRKTYKHTIQLQAQTKGGRRDQSAQAELEAQCDSQHRHLKAQLRLKRSPLFDESSQWTMKTEVQAMLPETHSSVRSYQQNQGQKQQQFVAKINSEWGADRKQQIQVNVQGQQARNPEWRNKIQQVEKLNTPDAQKLRQQMIQKVAFVNKYDISAEYQNLEPATKNVFNQLATILKAWNFWQTKTELRQQRDSQQRVQATVVIDAMTHEHANITLKTPYEIVRIDSLSLPIKTKPFKLVQPGQIQQSYDSFNDVLVDYATETGRQECKVDSRKVQSFDDVIFKAPITKCYSVLAKDCEQPEQPRYVVMIKKIEGNDKKLKVLTRQRDSIEVEPKNGDLVVKINGRREDNEETLKDYGVTYSSDMVKIANRDITVRFDGQQVTLKLASTHKTTQCGLCGNYNDNAEDDFRMADNELTDDLKTYHKSYSLVEDECRTDFEKTHQEQEYKKSNKKYFEDEDEEYQQKRRRTDDGDVEPIEKTEVLEYNHKVCFSAKPVKACPEDSYPQKTKEHKIQFACMDRSSAEARRLLREARRADRPVDLPRELKSSFVETITVPTACVVY